jgi:hypothetical protein
VSRRSTCSRRWPFGSAMFVLLVWPTIGLFAQADAKEALRACSEETAMRLKISDKDVVAQPSDAQTQQEGGTLLRWFTAGGAQGECRYENSRLTSWTITRKGRRFNAEEACAAAVAKLQRMRPEDVEVVDSEKRSQTTSTLFWTTYQGDTGKCLARQNRIESVERD